MTYRDYKSFWDIFLNKWRSNHDDLIQNDPAGQAFFAINSSGNYINSDLYTSITCMPEPYYFGSNFLNATDWSDFNDAIVVLDLNPGLSHESDSLKSKNSPSHLFWKTWQKGVIQRASTMISILLSSVQIKVFRG